MNAAASAQRDAKYAGDAKYEIDICKEKIALIRQTLGTRGRERWNIKENSSPARGLSRIPQEQRRSTYVSLIAFSGKNGF